MDEQKPLNEDSPMPVIVFGNSMCSKDEHPLNENFLIVATDSGNFISNRDEHPSKTDSSIVSIDEGRLILDKDLQFLNAYFSIVVNCDCLSNVIFDNETHNSNEFWPIIVMFFGIVIFLKYCKL